MWRTGWPGPGSLAPAPADKALRQLASLTANWARRNGLAPQRRKAVAPPATAVAGGMPDISPHYYFPAWRARRACSRPAAYIASTADPDAIRGRRRRNWKQIAAALREQGAKLLFDDLPAGVSPLCCPVLAPDRDRLADALAARGIHTSRWWSGGHWAIDWPAYPNACKLKQTLLPLPVHQQLDDVDIERVLSSFKESRL